MFDFLFRKPMQPKQTTPPPLPLQLPNIDIKINKRFKKKTKQNYMYIVVKKNTFDILGIYTTVELAKKNGEESTYHSCSIYKYKINDAPKYINTPIYENH